MDLPDPRPVCLKPFEYLKSCRLFWQKEEGEKAITASLLCFPYYNLEEAREGAGAEDKKPMQSRPLPEGTEQHFSNFNICCFILYSSCQHNLLLWE